MHLRLPLAKDPCTGPCFSGVEDVENALLEIWTAASQTVKMTRRGQAQRTSRDAAEATANATLPRAVPLARSTNFTHPHQLEN
jgi:hypothetical protein